MSSNSADSDRARPLSSLLQLLKAQASAALSEDAGIQREVKGARAVLGRVAEASSRALRKLNETEQELELKWGQLAALLTEVKRLEMERAEALDLARQFRAQAPSVLADDDLDIDSLSVAHGSTAPMVPSIAAVRASAG
jgi:hypothetical protein